MSDLEKIANAIENLEDDGYPKEVRISMGEDDNVYWLLKGIEYELVRIADALTNKEEG